MVGKMKRNQEKISIITIYDNYQVNPDLKTGWGFSCLVEVRNGLKILFDTGADGKTLLYNMKKLGTNPALIDEVFISHTHFDHIGGLSEFLNINKKAKIYIPPSLHGLKGREINRLFILESLIIMISSGTIGILVGWVTSWLVTSQLMGTLMGMPTVLYVPWFNIILIYSLSIGMIYFGMKFLLRKVRKKKIVEIYRETL